MASVDCSALRMASDLGTSSPKMMVMKVMMTKARIAGQRGVECRRPNRSEKATAPSQPSPRLAAVTPSWVAERYAARWLDDVVGHPGAPAALGGQLRDAGVAHLDDGELGDDEEGVHDDEDEDADDLEGGGTHRRLTRGCRAGAECEDFGNLQSVFISLHSSIA